MDGPTQRSKGLPKVEVQALPSARWRSQLPPPMTGELAGGQANVVFARFMAARSDPIGHCFLGDSLGPWTGAILRLCWYSCRGSRGCLRTSTVEARCSMAPMKRTAPSSEAMSSGCSGPNVSTRPTRFELDYPRGPRHAAQWRNEAQKCCSLTRGITQLRRKGSCRSRQPRASKFLVAINSLRYMGR